MPDESASDPRNDTASPQVAILGLGQMGLCCAAMLAGPDPKVPGGARPRVRLWGHEEGEVGRLSQTRRSDRLPGFELPGSARVALSDGEALEGADIVVAAVPSQVMRETFARLGRFIPRDAGIVSVAKGIENETLMRPSQVIADMLGDDPDARPRPIAALSGPSIATELARGMPATMVAASDDPAFAERVQLLFSTSYLRVYTNDDLLGVELAGAVKNVIAIAAGVLDGLNAGFNAKSALLARGLAEITRLGTAMGGSTHTFFGVAGMGDLVTTCFSPEGRNRACGEALGRGENLDDYLERSRFVVEGVATTKSVIDLAERYRVEMPITRAVHDVVFEGLDPVRAIAKLMSRELRDEREG
ncbi:MAG: glycerol-3-phosphate dehydrogenase [NAD(P)+] [Phycisphaeraceae bacterium]|nr:MAG: glycerol-3-phosphate dehydrogenase [NAD(P)+] [Phycisphaeraceae bacterium]